MLTAERARELLEYDPFTGNFRWKIKPSNVAKDGPGCLRPDGYYVIRIDKKCYRCSRIAWLIMTGEWPKGQIDHRNMNRSDNRFENLRDATDLQNRGNCGARKHNKSGFKGVQKSRNCRRWIARMTVNYQTVVIGRYDTPEEAHEAYMVAARERYGEFARATSQ